MRPAQLAAASLPRCAPLSYCGSLRQTGAAKRWGETLLRRAENKALSRLSYLHSRWLPSLDVVRERNWNPTFSRTWHADQRATFLMSVVWHVTTCLGQIFFLDARRDEWIDKGEIITGE